jgi:phosphoserine phosphatase
MEIAITFVAAPGSEHLLADLGQRVSASTGSSVKQIWLAGSEALDVGLDECPEIKKLAASLVGSQPIDWCVQPAEGRRKRMLIADMDSTIIGQECLDEMADLKGIKPEIAALTERAMRGELDFEGALRERIRLLAGLTESDLQRVLDERITLNPGARTLVETMKAHGAHTVLVSGGFTFFTQAVAERVGFADNRANVFLWESGRISGVAEPILGREAKLAALKEEAIARGITPGEVIAVGDGANDLAMLAAAGLGVAYRAKPVVAAQAAAQVNYTDLTTLLYFQGYARSEFKAAG